MVLGVVRRNRRGKALLAERKDNNLEEKVSMTRPDGTTAVGSRSLDDVLGVVAIFMTLDGSNPFKLKKRERAQRKVLWDRRSRATNEYMALFRTGHRALEVPGLNGI